MVKKKIARKSRIYKQIYYASLYIEKKIQIIQYANQNPGPCEKTNFIINIIFVMGYVSHKK